jgi:hypothetical protein
VVLGAGIRKNAGADDNVLGLLTTVEMTRELRRGGSGRNDSHDSGILADHATIEPDRMEQQAG